MATGDRKFPSNITDRLTCRQVLNIMVILGFMFNYMLRVNLTIAIVAMVVPGNKTDTSHSNATLTECSDYSLPPDNTTLLSGTPVQQPETFDGMRFEWDEYEQNMILGCFFWGYVMTELPGGRLAEVIGGHRVFGYSMLSASVLTLLTPLAAKLDYLAVVILRVLLGLMLGATWPSIHPMTARWIPPTERSKFMSNMMASSLGAAITMPVCGFLIASLGWESVFYVTGVVGLVWSIVWFFVVFDSPAQHPRISEEERQFIEKAIGDSTSQGKAHRVPWFSILTSPCVWAIIITHGASVFGYFTVVNQLPTYMKHILHFNIKANGLLSSMPYLGKYVFAVLTSALADYFLRTKKFTRTTTRKLFTAVALAIPSATMIGQMFLGCDRAASVAFFTVALTINGAVCGGYLGNGLDIAPNFSGTIFGMANTLSSLGGFLSSLMVGMLTQDNQTYTQWRKVFGIIAATYAGGAIVYSVFGTGELQSWNSGPKSTDKDEAEKEKIPLRNDKV
ncbi:sialin isoform X1 [Zootermopsis nevadensis]|uniref:sialin isoform X1 n=2 Tax=Zootermopsis nevadensis TaxID=136037 RepID=UPI000B8EDADA|nr:sialin isoform X1 [Zootermopsis nevadensis]